MDNVSKASLSILYLPELKGQSGQSRDALPGGTGVASSLSLAVASSGPLLLLGLSGRALGGFSRSVTLREGLLAGATVDRR